MLLCRTRGRYAAPVSRSGSTERRGLRQLPELGADAGKAALDPANCLVIEDAPAGIQSAHASGMDVIAVSTTYPVSALSAADAIVNDLSAIRANISLLSPELGTLRKNRAIGKNRIIIRTSTHDRS